MHHDYEAIVTDTLNTPGKLSERYSAFRNYSFGNQWFGKLHFSREMTPIDQRKVVRMNRDRIYAKRILMVPIWSAVMPVRHELGALRQP
jgi:hypothetical protein